MYTITKSKRLNKKFKVETPSGKTIHFGDSRYDDFTKHKDYDRRDRYLTRHSDENWDDPETAGFWARWLLWNLPSFNESLRDISKRFNIRIISNISLN